MRMIGDLLIITPSRGRPQNIMRLLNAVHETSRLRTHSHVAVDEDDPQLEAYHSVMNKHGKDDDSLEHGPRKGLAARTNARGARRGSQYRFLASFGDDMVPRTKGFDKALCRAIEDMDGTGFSYPWDGIREDTPEAIVMSSNIMQALGWICEPGLEHFWVDNVWGDLGRGAGCIRHLRAVAVDHLHPDAGKAVMDSTYDESNKKIQADCD